MIRIVRLMLKSQMISKSSLRRDFQFNGLRLKGHVAHSHRELTLY